MRRAAYNMRMKSAPGKPVPVRVGRETKGRGGKGVTVITGLRLSVAELEAIAGELKRRCNQPIEPAAGPEDEEQPEEQDFSE